MTTYRKIHGRSIQAVTTDPTESVAEGQVWYNTTSDTFKSVVASGSWSSGPNVNTARINGSASGIQTAAVYAGGNAPPYSTATEEYNGTGFSVGGNMNDNRDPYAGFGTLTDTVTAGGYDGSNKAESETYNGTSWSEGNNLNTARRGQQGFGTSGDAGVCCGGYTTTASTATEEYDGSSWTTVNAMPTARYSGCAVGAQTSGIQVAGDPGSLATSFEYDGTNWSSGGTLSTGRSFIMLGGANQDAVIAFGGETSPGAITTGSENYDGTSWTAGTSSGTGHKNISCGGWGTKTATFAAFGNGPPGSQISTTEEYNVSANVITAAAWASGGTLPVAVYDNAGAGTKNAGLSFGGDTAPDGKTTATFEYDGSSWTAGGALNTGRRELGGFGLQTAAVAACGGNYPASTLTEEYNGSSWTAGNAASTARTMMGAAGVLTAGIVCGGNPGTMTTTEEYDGTNWSSGGALPVGKQSNDSFGNVVTAIHNAGGNTAPASYVNTSEAYDGTNWTSGPTMTYGADRVSATGSSTSGLVFSGRLGPSTSRTAATMYFDGTSFVSAPSLSAARSGGQASGKGETSNASSFVAGGGGPSRKDTTEEFTGETTAINVKTLTQS